MSYYETVADIMAAAKKDTRTIGGVSIMRLVARIEQLEKSNVQLSKMLGKYDTACECGCMDIVCAECGEER